MTMPIEKPDGIIRQDLVVAIISLFLLLIAKPLFADTLIIAQATTSPVTSPVTSSVTSPVTSPANPTMTATPSPQAGTTQSQSTYLNPPAATPTITPGSSQSQRDASARQSQNGTNMNNPPPQPLPECKIEDSACIEQRNRMNQMNPTAPTFNR